MKAPVKWIAISVAATVIGGLVLDYIRDRRA